MRVTPQAQALRRWRIWFGALVVAEICWFALLRPPLATHFGTLLWLSLLPLAVVGYIYVLAAISSYLDSRDWELVIRQLIVIMLGLSVGFFLSALMWLASVHLEGELG